MSGTGSTTPIPARVRSELGSGATDGVGGVAAWAAWAARRPALLRVCAGEALIITDSDLKLLDIVNQARELYDLIIDRRQDPDDYRLAEVIVERLADRHGIRRQAGGDRVIDVLTDVGRYLVPEAVERAYQAPAHQRGVGSLLIHDVARVPSMLAGDEDLPAATVASDLLGRRAAAIRCLWLTPDDAALVTVGGADALRDAIRTGTVPVHRDARTGEPVIAPIDLRRAGRLIEKNDARPLKESSAQEVLRTLKLSIKRARDCGASIRGTFDLEAIKPIEPEQDTEVEEEPKLDYVSLELAYDICRDLGVVSQVCLWLMRLVGLRISEAFGLHVADYRRDAAGRPLLDIHRQGGAAKLVRGRDGHLSKADEKQGAKASSERTVPIATPLAILLDHLIDIFHTDADGHVDLDARLLPGIGKTGASGKSTVRTQLERACAKRGIRITPHTMRGAFITDLDLEETIREVVQLAYPGHRAPKNIQQAHYIRQPSVDELMPVVEAVDRACAEALETDDLRVPTPVRQTWRRANELWTRRETIEARLVSSGWLLPETTTNDYVTLSSAAAILGCTTRTIRRHISNGDIAATEGGSTRSTLLVATDDVLALKQRNHQPTISEVAQQLHMTYHQAWHMLRDLGVVPADHEPGQHMRLNHQAIEALRDEQERRAGILAGVVSTAEAATLLDLPATVIGTLLRRGDLTEGERPDARRGRYITRKSIAEYNEAYPPHDKPAQLEAPAISCTEARRLMGISTPTLSRLGMSRQVRQISKPGSSHVYIAVESIRDWAKREGHVAVVRVAQQLLDDHQANRTGHLEQLGDRGAAGLDVMPSQVVQPGDGGGFPDC